MAIDAEDFGTAQVEITRTTPFRYLPEYLTPAEYANWLGLTSWTVYQQIHQGKIPHTRFGKKFRIPKACLDPNNAQPALVHP